jgi:hypothetical protein
MTTILTQGAQKESDFPKLEPFKADIDEWLTDDKKAKRKQRHTARRVYDRLVEKYQKDFECSYRSVAGYVAKKKKEIYHSQPGYLPLEHIPGEAQADFGDADFYENGHFGIHLPDSEGKTKINITPQYKVLLKYIINNPPSNLDLNHHAGELHSDIKGMTDKSHKLIINNRCGLIKEGRVDYHPNVLKCGHQFQFTHDEGGCVLLPNGDCVTCCQSFNLQEKLGNLFTQSWEEIKTNIKLMEMCTHCRYVIE